MKGFFGRLSALSIFGGLVFFPVCAWAFLINEWERLETASVERRADEEPVAGKDWTDSSSGIRFIWIPGRCFQMGSPPWMDGRENDEGPVHQVCLGDFWLSQREVTQRQWMNVMRINPAFFQKGDDHPVEQVTWSDTEFLSGSLNERYKGRARFRLPTEAEWEYVCREGGESLVYAGRAEPHRLAWMVDNSHQSTQPTGTREPNRLGLLDMSGNVWEWTQDSYRPDAYSQHVEKDPTVVDEGFFKVIRGGGWKDGMAGLRCVNRGFERYSSRRPDVGFRIAAVVDIGSDEKRPPLFEVPF